MHICCSDPDRKYKYVSVQNFINAFATTDTAKRTQGKLAAPVVVNEKAEDPLVRELPLLHPSCLTSGFHWHWTCAVVPKHLQGAGGC